MGIFSRLFGSHGDEEVGLAGLPGGATYVPARPLPPQLELRVGDAVVIAGTPMQVTERVLHEDGERAEAKLVAGATQYWLEESPNYDAGDRLALWRVRDDVAQSAEGRVEVIDGIRYEDFGTSVDGGASWQGPEGLTKPITRYCTDFEVEGYTFDEDAPFVPAAVHSMWLHDEARDEDLADELCVSEMVPLRDIVVERA